MPRNNADFHLQPNSAGGYIRVGSLVNNPAVKFLDVEQGQTMEQKLKQSKTRKVGNLGESVYDSIKTLGVKEPIAITFNSSGVATVVGGHHRVAAAHDIDPNMSIPWLRHPEGYVQRQMGTTGNCPSCYGDGTDWDREDGGGTCATCGGHGVR